MTRTVLSLCDHSGVWSAPYAEAGYEVVRVDIQAGQDVRLLEYRGRVHGILAAPPCTLFSRAGAWTWPRRPASDLADALAIVDACLRIITVHRPVWWALENPPGRLARWLGPPAFTFDPCDYGDPWTKKTHLWGHFTPPVGMFTSRREVPPVLGDITTRMSSSAKNARSQTPAGFARAFHEANP